MAVTITESAGYGDDHVDALEWADIIPHAGQAYGVADEASWVARTGAADREVRLSPGRGFGGGVRDRTGSEASLILPATVSGSVYHLIHVHRDWGNNRSTFDTKAGTAAREIPARNVSPGLLDDQPLWLARVDAGKSQVQELVDLRVFNGYAFDDLVRQYMNRLGTTLRIGYAEWNRRLNTLGQRVWVGGPPQTEAQNLISTGAIVERGAEGQIGAFTPAEGKRMVRMFCSVSLWLPVGNYAGLIRLMRGDKEIAIRRWHSHLRGLLYLMPSFEYTEAPIEGIPAGVPMRVMVSVDVNSSGPIEVWDAYVNWTAE